MSNKKPNQDDDILAPHKIPQDGGKSFAADWEEKADSIQTTKHETTKIEKTPSHQIIEDDWDPQF